MSSNVETLLSALDGVRENVSGWSALCPAHHDKNPSLSIGVGDDGRVLLHCHAGCSPKAIIEAVRLTEADLFVADCPQQKTVKPRERSKKYATVEAAQEIYERKHGKPSAMYDYIVGDEKVGRVLRWDYADGKKTIRPVGRHPDGWQPGAMCVPRPLYRQDEVMQSNGRVFVVEGEKCVEAMREMGFVATTSPGGCNSTGKTDWSMLRGREVVIMPDADPGGRDYATKTAAVLQQLNPPATVRILEFDPAADDGSDIADLFSKCAGHPDQTDALVETIVATVESLEPLVTTTTTAASKTSTVTTAGFECGEKDKNQISTHTWTPYPFKLLPEPMRDFVNEAATSISCDPCYVALPLLAAAGAAIGMTSRLALKSDWIVPSIIWPVLVGESGTAKSPALAAAIKHAHRHEKKLRDQHQSDLDDYETAKATYEKSFSAWQKSKKEDEPPARPRYPVPKRAVVVDPTVEALSNVLADNPRGVLLPRDELSGWFGSMDRYVSSKGGGDDAFWCSCYGGEPHSVDRRTGNRPSIYIESAAVWITGCIPPAVLRRSVGRERRESGLLARLLLAAPPPRPQLWSDTTIDVLTKDRLSNVLDGLYGLSCTTDSSGNACPREIRLNHEAQDVWVSWQNEHAHQTVDHVGDLNRAWAKLKELPARLALILHEVEVVAGLHDRPDEISVATLDSAIQLTEWHKAETVRVYQQLAETDEETVTRQQDDRLLAFIERRDGSVTVRDVVTGCRYVKSSEEAEVALTRLAASGAGSWQSKPPGPKGGRPTRVFVLSAQPRQK
jgi:hypothetical protein